MRKLVCLAAVALGLAVASPAQASFPGRNGAVVEGPVCCSESYAYLIYGDMSVSTGAVEFPRNISVSPGGTKVAFDGPATSLGTQRAIYVENLDGTGLRQVGRGDLKRYNPAWSPDGTKLIFVQDNGANGSGDIYTMTTSGGSLRRLTTASGWDGSPDWSPDGTKIAYTCRSGGATHICTMTPTGGSKTVLPKGSNPSWSPDSKNIAYNNRTTGIWRMTRSGGSPLLLYAQDQYGDAGAYGPIWSPDNSKIMFEVYAGDGAFGLYTVNAVDGSGGTFAGGYGDSDQLIDPSGWQALH